MCVSHAAACDTNTNCEEADFSSPTPPTGNLLLVCQKLWTYPRLPRKVSCVSEMKTENPGVFIVIPKDR